MAFPVQVASPEALALRKTSEPPIVVEVRKKAGPAYPPVPSFWLQGNLVEENQLRAQLEKELGGSQKRMVIVYGDRELPFQTVVNVMDVINRLGATPVLIGGKQRDAGCRRCLKH